MLDILRKDALAGTLYACDLMETMGQRIRRLREARGWTQADLAKIAEVTVQAVSQWELETTKNVKLVPFLAIARALDTDPYYLVFGPDRAPVDPQGRPGRPAAGASPKR